MKLRKDPNAKLSDTEIEECVQVVVATQRMEGQHVSDGEVDMLRQYLSGAMSNGDYDKKMFEKAGAVL